MAQVVKEQLETTLAGFTLNLTVEPKKQRVQDMQDGNFEIGLTRWGPDYADPMTYLGMWVTGNSNNYGLWSDADYDAIIDECTTGDLCPTPRAAGLPCTGRADRSGAGGHLPPVRPVQCRDGLLCRYRRSVPPRGTEPRIQERC